MQEHVDLTVLILAKNEGDNIGPLIAKALEVVHRLGVEHEIVVIDDHSTDQTVSAAKAAGAKVVTQQKPGFGNALREGFLNSQGVYILTLDADFSHHPVFILRMWAARQEAEIIIGSRYVTGGGAEMPLTRKLLSKTLNRCYAFGLSIPAKDLSSNFRLYRSDVLKQIHLEGEAFDVLEEVLVKLYSSGGRIKEIPMYYRSRLKGSSKARIFPFGVQLARTFFSLWRLRNSIASADYDERAYFSRIPLQRYWQRKRHKIIINYSIDSHLVLDVGCGSSVIARSHPNLIGLDTSFSKLFFMRKYLLSLVQGSVYALPFPDNTFDGVICSNVIEHIPKNQAWIRELKRVIKPKGHLVLATPDYGLPWWPMIERIYGFVKPDGYAREHISPYNYDELVELLTKENITVISHDYILKSELIIKAQLQ